MISETMLTFCYSAVALSLGMVVLTALTAVRVHHPIRNRKYPPIEWPPSFEEILSDSSTHYWCR